MSTTLHDTPAAAPITPGAAPTATPSPRSDRLAGKVALITGGNSGIGLATAEAFLAAGAQVAISGRDEATLAAAARALGPDREGGSVLAVRADASRLAELDALMTAVSARFGRRDVLFVNAGIGEFVPVDQASEAHFDRLFDVNVKGAYFTVQRALPLLARGASVLLNGSNSGLVGMAGTSVYAATKAAVRSLARTLSADLLDRGIRVNVISAGPVSTPGYDRLGLPPEALAATKAGIQARVPLGRFASPDEIGNTAVFLASDESRFYVGAELVPDGGMSQL